MEQNNKTTQELIDELHTLKARLADAERNAKAGDITERKKRKEELNRLNRTLKSLRNSSQAMMRAKDDSEYLQQVCRIVVEDCGHAMVWIGYAEDDEYKSVRPVAYSGFEAGYLETLKITWADTERGRGPTGTAIRTGKPSMCRNMLTDPKFAPWREEALKRGYAASIVLPLMGDDKAFGAISIYSREPDPFSEEETALLNELAGDLAYGIRSIRMRKARERAEGELRETRDYLAKLINYANAPIIVWDAASKIIQFNHAFEHFTGYTAVEVIGQDLRLLFPESSRENSLQQITRTLTGEYWESVEIPILRKDGATRIALWSSANIYAKDGKTLVATIAQGQDITERIHTEAALHNTHQKVKNILESITEMYLVLDPKWRVIELNKSIEVLFNKSNHELIGNVFWDIFPQAVGSEFYKQFHKAMQDQIPVHFEAISQIVPKWFETHVYPTKDSITIYFHDITARKKIEVSLRESEEKYRTVIENTGTGIILVNDTGVFDMVNTEFESLSGYSKSELEGKMRWIEFVAKSDVERMQRYFNKRKVDSSSVPSNYEFTFINRQGEHKFIYLSVARIQGIKKTVASLLDITERKKAEASMLRLASFPTLNPNPIIELDRDNKIHYMNPAAARKFTDLGRAGDIHAFIEGILSTEKIKKAKEPLTREVNLGNVWYHQTLFYDQSTNRIRIYSFDITKRKQAEQALQRAREELELQVEERTRDLRQANELLERIFSSTNFLIAYLDKDFNFIRVNEPYANVDERTPDYFIGKNHFALYPNAENETIFRKVVETGEPFTAYTKPFVYETLSRHKATYWDWSLQPVKGISGKVEGLIFILVDVTERRAAEEQLSRVQEELHQAKRLVDIGMLAATVAHELRNPLGVIKVASYNLRRKSVDAVFDKHLANIEKKVLESDQIINNLLFYTRVKEPHYENIAALGILDECIQNCAKRYETWQIKLKKRYHIKRNMMIEADSLHMTELFNNILNNAYQAFPEKRGTIKVTVAASKANGNIEFAFTDTGIGIAKDDLGKVFDPFFSTKSKGTGLGLSLCKQIVTLHGGTIEMQSEPNEGTTVLISLPMKRNQ